MANLYDGMTKTAIKTFMDELKVQWTYTSNAIEGNTISLGETAFIIEKNEYFKNIYEFFKAEYQNSQVLLDEIKG